jgi:hypothetical protein
MKAAMNTGSRCASLLPLVTVEVAAAPPVPIGTDVMVTATSLADSEIDAKLTTVVVTPSLVTVTVDASSADVFSCWLAVDVAVARLYTVR